MGSICGGQDDRKDVCDLDIGLDKEKDSISKKENIVLVYGYFDPFSVIHVHSLIESRKFGEVIVCIASDRQIIESTGREPILSEKERAYLVENIKGVESVVVLAGNFEERSNFRSLLKKIKPDLVHVVEKEEGNAEILCRELGISFSVICWKRNCKTKIEENKLVEILASCIHDGWLYSKRRFGYSFGFERSTEKKVHGHLLPFLACHEKNRAKDCIIAKKILQFLRSEKNITKELLASKIHDLSVELIPEERRENHPHANAKWKDHDEEGRLEHLTQAQFVIDVWKNFHRFGLSSIQ